MLEWRNLIILGDDEAGASGYGLTNEVSPVGKADGTIHINGSTTDAK
jgi:hypothetical protein